MLEVRNLTKVYNDGTVALQDVSFTVEDGEFLIVIGLSGGQQQRVGIARTLK